MSVCMTTISLYIFHPYGGGQRRTGTLYSNKEHCPTSFVFSFLFRALFFFFCFFIFFYLFFFDHSCFFLSFFCDVSLIHSSIQHQTNNKNTKQTILKKTSNTKQKLKKKHQTQNKNKKIIKKIKHQTGKNQTNNQPTHLQRPALPTSLRTARTR